MNRPHLPAGRRWPLRAAAAGGLVFVQWVALGAGPAWAHSGHRLTDAGPWWTRVGEPASRATAVSLAVPLVGLLLGPAITRLPVGRGHRRRWVRTLAGAMGAGVLLAAVWSDSPSPVPPAVLGLLALAAVAGGGSRRGDVLLGLAVAGGAVGLDPPRGVELWVAVSHLMFASAWVGVALHVALFSTPGPSHALQRREVHRAAMVLSAGVVVTGLWNTRLHVSTEQQILATPYGRTVALKFLLVALAAALGWAAHRWSRSRPRRSRGLMGWEAGGLAGVVGATTLLLALPVPPVLASATAGLGTTYSEDDAVSALSVPAQGGGRDVYVGLGDDTGGISLGDGASGARTALAKVGVGRWYAHLPGSGHGQLTVDIKGRRPIQIELQPLPIGAARPGTYPVASAAPDVVVARAVAAGAGVDLNHAGPDAAVPQSVQDQRDGADMADYLVHHYVRSVDLVADGRGESAPFALGFSTEAGRLPIAVRTWDPRWGAPAADALVLATDALDAQAELNAAVKARAYPGGVHLAPWLLQSGLMEGATQGGPEVDVQAVDDPTSPLAEEYLRRVRVIAPGFDPTATGLRAFLEVLGNRLTTREWQVPRIYAVAGVQFLPPLLDTGHSGEGGGWFSGGGQLVPLTS